MIAAERKGDSVLIYDADAAEELPEEVVLVAAGPSRSLWTSRLSRDECRSAVAI